VAVRPADQLSQPPAAGDLALASPRKSVVWRGSDPRFSKHAIVRCGGAIRFSNELNADYFPASPDDLTRLSLCGILQKRQFEPLRHLRRHSKDDLCAVL
jgi:hypothetical protein